MKTSSALDLRNFSAPTLSFRSLASHELRPRLSSFFANMTFDQRRARFGCGMSDDAILRYCRGLDADTTSVIGCLGQHALVACVELHGMASRGSCAELALANLATEDRLMIYGHLLQLAAFTAGRNGCATLILARDHLEPDLLDLLRGMGRVDVRDEALFVDVGDYVRPFIQGA